MSNSSQPVSFSSHTYSQISFSFISQFPALTLPSPSLFFFSSSVTTPPQGGVKSLFTKAALWEAQTQDLPIMRLMHCPLHQESNQSSVLLFYSYLDPFNLFFQLFVKGNNIIVMWDSGAWFGRFVPKHNSLVDSSFTLVWNFAPHGALQPCSAVWAPTANIHWVPCYVPSTLSGTDNRHQQ